MFDINSKKPLSYLPLLLAPGPLPFYIKMSYSIYLKEIEKQRWQFFMTKNDLTHELI